MGVYTLTEVHPRVWTGRKGEKKVDCDAVSNNVHDGEAQQCQCWLSVIRTENAGLGFPCDRRLSLVYSIVLCRIRVRSQRRAHRQ